MNIKESMQCLDRMIKKAKENNLKIRAGIQCVWGCAYDGSPNEKKFPSTLILPYKKYKFYTKIKLKELN